MAEALVDALVGRLATVAFKLFTGVETEVKRLARTLEAIHAVMEDAKQRQVTEATVRRCLSELTDVCYEADDVLDEWSTELQKQQMEKQEKQGENALIVTTQKKVCFPFFSSCFCCGQINRSMFRRDIAVRIRELNKRLDLLFAATRSISLHNITRVAESPQRQVTASFLVDKTFGREKERNLIVSKLLSESGEGNEVPLIIPIVGMAGMGKTTLAQLVYNDEIVQSHFDKRIWVCVADPFDKIRIARDIVKGLDEDNTLQDSNELGILIDCISNLIDHQKFLLVLDDVWNQDPSLWESLFTPLRNGARGSRVLVTTRKEQVAEMMNATSHMIRLRQLSEEFCLSLFYHNADMDIASESTMFQTIGYEIVKKSNGLPLVAKTLGLLMRDKRTIAEWKNIVNSKIWELEVIQENVFKSLLLSYHDLAPMIKRCLLYCVIFPKDYVFDRDSLIELWMSQDYLIGENGKKIIGQESFDSLPMCSFFQDVEVDKHGKTRCKLEVIVHDFLQYLAKNECYAVDFELGPNERMEDPNNKVRHLTLLNAGGSETSWHCKCLRTLVAFDPSITFIGAQKLIVQSKCLRTLNLCHNEIKEIPKEMGELIHLRYLDLSDNRYLEKLPDTMSSLFNLQTLRLANCSSLKKVDLRRLINLRHLYVNGSEDLKLMGIETLTHLQRLDMFYVQSDANNEGNKLGDLESLNELEGELTIGNMRNAKFAEKANMVNKCLLFQLCLEFRNNYPEQHFAPEEDREILNAFEPHPNLKSLRINGYSGTTLSTSWLSSHSLRVLSLECCYDCEFFPNLGNLLSLESLYMGSFYVIKVGVEFLGIDDDDHSEIRPVSTLISFPKLRQLAIDYMLFWEEWEGVKENSGSVTIMPQLTELTISKCNYLKSLPDFLWRTPLQKLDISESRILQDVYKHGSEERAKVSPNITCQIQQGDDDED